MNTQDLLKQAADALRAAEQMRRQEIDELRRYIDQKSQQDQDRISALRAQESNRLSQAVATSSESATAANIRDSGMLKAEEAQVKANLDQERKEIDNIIAAKQRNVSEINQAAQTITNWMNL